MKRFLSILTTLIMLLMLGGCGAATESDEPQDDTPQPVVGGDNFATHHQLIDELYDGHNITVSEFSLNMLLAMLANGADSETLCELEKYMNVNVDKSNELSSQFMEYYDSLEGCEVLLANGAWTDSETFSLSKDFAGAIKDTFDADCRELNFSDPSAADVINDWCSENTKGLIPELVDSNSLQGASAVLANALYFNGTWETPYEDAQVTEDETFTNADGSESKVTMLRSTEDRYLENDKATGFMKPYSDGIYYVGILPKEEGDFNMADLDIDTLIHTEISDTQASVTMPEFEMKNDFDLNDVLKSLGITRIFDPSSSQLSGLGQDVNGNPAYVSLIKQKTAVKLNKEGTEAAAVTGGVMKTMALDPEEMQTMEVTLDRPFAFLIYDAANDSILFEGKIVQGAVK